MKPEKTIPAEELEDKENEERICYGKQMHRAMAPVIKKFLVDFFGVRMYNLESETYREIDEIIKDAFLFGCNFAVTLFINVKIKDEDFWEKAYTNFTRKAGKFTWQKTPPWYDREYV